MVAYTGEASGKVEYRLIGHTANLAPRIESLAPAGSIAISWGTRKLCEGYFELLELGPATGKGSARWSTLRGPGAGSAIKSFRIVCAPRTHPLRWARPRSGADAARTEFCVRWPWAAPEAKRPFSRVRDICEQLGDEGALVPALFGRWSNYHVRGLYRAARDYAFQLLERAQKVADHAFLLMAHYALSMTLFHTGEFLLARRRQEKMLSIYDAECDFFLIPHRPRPQAMNSVICRLDAVALRLSRSSGGS